MTRSVHVVGNVQMDVLASPVTAMPKPGGDDIIDRIAVRPAGAAGNVSLALAALEVEHRLFGAVGDDQAGIWVADELHRAGVGADLQVVKERLGHGSIATTERYLHTLPDADDTAINALSNMRKRNSHAE